MREGLLARLVPAAALAALVMAGLHMKARLSTLTPRYRPDDATGYFRSESAMQYRYAAKVARGEGIPALDQEAQFPEGIRTGRELALGMEYATGWAYRYLPVPHPPDFRWFVVLWVALVSSLSIPALYLIGWRLTRSRPWAFAGAAAYGLSWAAQSNVAGTYRLESFALPLIHWSLAFLAGALDPEEERPPLHAAASGLLMAAAMASWHFARFHLAVLIAAGLWAWLQVARNKPAERRLLRCFGVILAFAAAATLLVPSLRESLWIASPGAYGHVYALLLAKLRFGLVKPADPASLSPLMRLEWIGPSNSPEAGFLLFALIPLVLVVLPRLVSAARREGTGGRANPLGPLLDGLLVLYAAGTVMAARLLPLSAFFLCAASLRLPEKALKKRWAVLLLAAVAGLEGLKSLAPASRLNPFMAISAAFSSADSHPSASFDNELAAILWAQRRGAGRPVLAAFGLSPSFLAYAESPILLQPKFEARGIRGKTAEFLEALYATEEEFHAFCRKYGAGLFVYTTDVILDETPDGPRYASGSLRLTSQTAAVRFHFHPGSLQLFRLVYENPDFRIYAVDAGGKDRAWTKAPDPIYDIGRYRARTLPDGSLKLDVSGVLSRIRAARFKLFLAKVFARLGKGEEALAAYDESFAAWPADEETVKEAERIREALSKAR